jgi:hypothetical protein
MSGLWWKFVSTNTNKQNEADNECQSGSNNDEGCSLVEVTILIIVESSGMYSFKVRVFIVVDMSCTSNCIKVLLPAKWRPTNRIVKIKQIAYPVRCLEDRAIEENISKFIFIVNNESKLFLISV